MGALWLKQQGKQSRLPLDVNSGFQIENKQNFSPKGTCQSTGNKKRKPWRPIITEILKRHGIKIDPNAKSVVFCLTFAYLFVLLCRLCSLTSLAAFDLLT